MSKPGIDTCPSDVHHANPYSLSNPLKYTDPSGHSVDCSIGDPYCKGGKLDVQRRARDLAGSLVRRKTPFTEVTAQQKSILIEGGFGSEASNQAIYNDFIGGNTADISGTLEDPAIYVGSVVKLGALIGLRASQLIGAYCIAYSNICRDLLTQSSRGLSQAQQIGGGGSDRLPRPPIPGGMGLNAFGKFIGWGTGNDAARARMQTITAQELRQGGLTVDMAVQWRDFYINEVARNPGNPSAAGRAELMDFIVGLLTRSQ